METPWVSRGKLEGVRIEKLCVGCKSATETLFTVRGVPSLWHALQRSSILQAVQQYMDTNTHAAEVRTTIMVTRWRNIVFFTSTI